MSTIGLNTQLMPAADASAAAIRAVCSTRSMFQDVERASGTGNTVWKPWMTSMPMMSGMPAPDSRAICWMSRMYSVLPVPYTPPSWPARRSLTFSSSSVTRMAEMNPGAECRFSWPIFCSRVIRDIRSSMYLSMSDLGAQAAMTASAAIIRYFFITLQR